MTAAVTVAIKWHCGWCNDGEAGIVLCSKCSQHHIPRYCRICNNTPQCPWVQAWSWLSPLFKIIIILCSADTAATCIWRCTWLPPRRAATRHNWGLAPKPFGKKLVCITYQCSTLLCHSNGVTIENCPEMLKDILQGISGCQFYIRKMPD